jgi:adenylate cyclase
MAQEGFKRKLIAILSADAVGYSRLMSEDESATVRTLTAYRKTMTQLIQQYRGRVVDSPGDNVLAEFASVVNAVQCAVSVQKEFKARNDELPENRRMQFRIGINLGDVIEEEDRIYGDGVNITARLEAMAEPGGICVSKTAFDHVEGKLPHGYHYLGEQNVKNISKPVGAYRVVIEPRVTMEEEEEKKKPSPEVEPASLEKMVFPLPDNPSIAVLPFDNFSGDPNQEYIADGFTENIIASLSQIPEMFVISRKSTFTYKGKPVKIRQVSEELGVRYVLEGSVQKAGDRLRITAQLIDALESHHLLAERYDRDFRDLFALQDEITMKILTALEVKLTRGEAARRYETENLEAWGYAVRAFSLWERLTKEDNAKARELVKQSLQLDPDYAFALVVLVRIHIHEARMGWSESPAESLKYALKLAQKTVALDDTIPDVHALLSYIYVMQMQHEQAIAEGERAIALGPSDAENHALLAHTLFYAGRFEDTIEHIKKAMRLSPYYPAWYQVYLADSYFMVGRYDESIAINKKLLDRALKGEYPIYTAHSGLAVNYMSIGQEEKGRAHAAELLRTNPSYSLETFRSRHPFKDPAVIERFLEPLSKAGIPEK